MWPSNNVSATQVSETETNNEPDNDHDDTLDAEISRLESTILELESLPDVDDFDGELEEGEIGDCEIDLCTLNDCITSTNEKEPLQCQKVSKSVASPKHSEEVTHKSKDCSSSTVDLLYNGHGNGMQCNKHDEKSITSSLTSIKDDFKEKQFDSDMSDFEEHIKYNNTSHPAFPVSSTPCRMKLMDFQKWKPRFLFKESFLILDECGEVSDQEYSISKDEKNISEKNLEQREVAFGQDEIEVLEVVVKGEIAVVDTPMSIGDGQTVENSKANHKPESTDEIPQQKPNILKSEEDLEVVVIGEIAVVNTQLSIDGGQTVEKSKVNYKPDSTDEIPGPKPNTLKSEDDLEVVVIGEIAVVNTHMSIDNGQTVKNSKANHEPESTDKIPEQKPNTLKSEEDLEVVVIGEEIAVVDTQMSIDAGQTVKNSKANHKPESTEEIPGQKPNTLKSEEDFFSKNPKENDDNNNPEWELLRKLETDEERYRAVRERWRNLVVPDPNKDLTYRTWRIRQNAKKTEVSASVTSNSEKKISGSVVPTVKRKRAFSEQTRMQQEAKRPRTQSCTAVYDVKLEQLRKNIEYEKQQITDEEHLALLQLSVQQNQEINYLRSFCYTHALDEEMCKLHDRQIADVEQLHKKFHDARLGVERKNSCELIVLEKAMEEVQTFHSFYQGLDHSNTGDTLMLSESQLEELWTTERLYEQYSNFYG